MAPGPRRAGARTDLQPVGPAADVGKLVVDRRRAHVAPPGARFSTSGRLLGADANALPGAATPLPALDDGGVVRELDQPELCRGPRVAGERDEQTLASLMRPRRPRPLDDLPVQALGGDPVSRLGCDVSE